jgi:hypothetical protein
MQTEFASSRAHLTTEKPAPTSTCLRRRGTTPAVLKSWKSAPRRSDGQAEQDSSHTEVRSALQANRTAMQLIASHVDITTCDAQVPCVAHRRRHVAYLRHQRAPRGSIALQRTRHFRRTDRRVWRTPRQLAHDLLCNVVVADHDPKDAMHEAAIMASGSKGTNAGALVSASQTLGPGRSPS